METRELQNEINNLLSRLGWSKKTAATKIFMEQNENDDDQKHIEQFYRSFTKNLSRDSIKPEKLIEYLKVLYMQKEVKRLDRVLPSYQKTGLLSNFMEDEMFKISKEINRVIK